MTVAELIEKLRDCPMHAEVFVFQHDGFGDGEQKLGGVIRDHEGSLYVEGRITLYAASDEDEL